MSGSARKDFAPDAKLSSEQRGADLNSCSIRAISPSVWKARLKTAENFSRSRRVQRGLLESGRPFACAAPTRAAVKELEKVGASGMRRAIKTLLDDPEKQAFPSRSCVDRGRGWDGGITKPCSSFCKSPPRSSTGRCSLGTLKQIRSVEAGDGLRILLKESKLKKATLREVWRQREELTDHMYRPTIEMLRDDPMHAFELLEAMKAVNPVKYNQRPRQTVEAALAEKDTKNAEGKPRSVLVVAPTHEEIGRYTEAIRAHLKAAGPTAGRQEN